MKKSLKRELSLLLLPVLVLGSFAWFRSRKAALEAPPEDLTIGKPRLVVGPWRELEPTPFDVYRGYTKKFEVGSWAGGVFPPLTSPGYPAPKRLYRQVSAEFPLPDLAYKCKGRWQIIPTDERQEDRDVGYEPFSAVEELRARVSRTVLVRLSALPKGTTEAELRGVIGASVQDRIDTVENGVNTNLIVNISRTLTAPVRVPLVDFTSVPLVSKDCPLQLVEVATSILPGFNQLDVTLNITTSQHKVYSAYVDSARLLDAEGHVLKSLASISAGPSQSGAGVDCDIGFSDVTPAERKSWKQPVTLQGALTLNDCWPLEVNVELPANGKPGAPRPSKLRFHR